MKKLFSSSVLFLIMVSVVAAEDVKITTYYPSPSGSYKKLNSDKLITDNNEAVATEYNAMQNGDAHIGRSLILGNATGFGFDDGAQPGVGGLLMSGNLGIGTTSATEALQIEGPADGGNILLRSATGDDPGDLIFRNSANTEYGRVYAVVSGLKLRSNANRDNDIFIKSSNGNVGIGNSSPTAKLHVENSLVPYPSTPLLNVGTYQTVSSGSLSSAIGNYARATGEDAVAIGVGTLASGSRSTALGYYALASGDQSTALGNFSEVRGLQSVVIGLTNNYGGGLTNLVTQSNTLAVLGGNMGIGTPAPSAQLDIGSANAAQCCATQTPNLSLAQPSNLAGWQDPAAGRMAWLQFHNTGESEAYIRLAGGGPKGTLRAGARRLEVNGNQGQPVNLEVPSGTVKFNPATVERWPNAAGTDIGQFTQGGVTFYHFGGKNGGFLATPNCGTLDLGIHSFCALSGISMRGPGTYWGAEVYYSSATGKWYLQECSYSNGQNQWAAAMCFG